MSSVPTETLDIVRQLRDLTEAGRLEWRESRPNRESHAVTISLASGQWRLTWHLNRQAISVSVWDGKGNALFGFNLKKTDPHFTEFNDLYTTAAQHIRRRITTTALNAMREELAAR